MTTTALARSHDTLEATLATVRPAAHVGRLSLASARVDSRLWLPDMQPAVGPTPHEAWVQEVCLLFPGATVVAP